MSKRNERYDELNSQLEQLTETIENASYQIPDSFNYSITINTNSKDLEEALYYHGDSVRDLGDSLIAGAGISLFTGLINAGIEKKTATLKTLLEEIDFIGKKKDLINSILRLQDNYPYLTFSFIKERAAVKGASEQEMKSLINHLCNEGILIEYRHGEKIAMKIDPDSEELQDFWDKLDKLRELIENEGKFLLK